MSKITLTYFDAPASRGEECRLALFLAGVPFTDERLSHAQWEERKATAPFGALPILTVEGQRPLAESNAILRAIGGMHGLLPSAPWDSARHEAVMSAVEDMRGRLRPSGRIKDPEEKRRAREEFAKDYLSGWVRSIERQIDGPFVGGAAISVADLKLFVALGPFLAGKMDHVPVEVFNSAPKLTALVEAVRNHPKVKEWRAKH
jgi:glutathione S-transferase